MNFQPSVMVWTVICFLILTVILKKLLFTPVLKVMDSRQEKIQAATAKKEAMEQLVLEHKNRAEKERVLLEEQNRKETKQKLEQIQLRSKKEIEASQRQCLADVQEYRDGISGERDRIVSSAAPYMETSAALFAKNILSHRI